MHMGRKTNTKQSMGVTLLPEGHPRGWCRMETRKASRADQAVQGTMAEQAVQGARETTGGTRADQTETGGAWSRRS